MDVKAREILQKVRSSAVDAGRTAGKVASDLMNQAKRNIRIAELNAEIEASYKNLGKMLYAVHDGVEIPADAIDEALAEIDGKKEEINGLRETVQKAKSDSVCPNCGKYVGKKAAYCSQCGTKIEREAEEPACECADDEACCEDECCDECCPAEEAVECVAEVVEEAVEKAADVVETVCEEACCCGEEKKEENE